MPLTLHSDKYELKNLCPKYHIMFYVKSPQQDLIKKNLAIKEKFFGFHSGYFWEILSKKYWRQISILGTNKKTI